MNQKIDNKNQQSKNNHYIKLYVQNDALMLWSINSLLNIKHNPR